ncbi:MAG TPA: hypothetical protein VFI49_02080 [Rudaea sp.]|nr:hypothetical protein [Rudaea sp.]
MKAFGMKSLSLAVLGLVGFGMASSASAVCPYPFNTAGGGAWSLQTTNNATLAAASPGLELVNPSACKMTAYINAGAGPLATGAVIDQSPTNEASYHFRFYIDTASLASMPNLATVQVFAANSAVNFPLSGNNQTLALMRLGLVGVGAVNPNLVAVSACNVPASNYRCLGQVALTPGVHWIEGHLTFGAAAITNIWVDKASITNDTTPAPDITLGTYDNSEWGGVETVALGLGGTSPNFRSGFSGPAHTVGFDNFDSRRQTFIGQ